MQRTVRGNPYLVTGAVDRRVGRARAKEDERRLLFGLTERLRRDAIMRRLDELSQRRVTIKVCVRDTPVPGVPAWQRSSPDLPPDTTETLCRADYYENENWLFNLLVAKLPLDQWGSATAGVTNYDLDNPMDIELYPYRSWSWPTRTRSPQRDEDVARERCHKVLREEILQIKTWQELSNQGPEDINAPWFNDRWCVTLWRTIKLSN